jgi:hypothetical protein
MAKTMWLYGLHNHISPIVYMIENAVIYVVIKPFFLVVNEEKNVINILKSISSHSQNIWNDDIGDMHPLILIQGH